MGYNHTGWQCFKVTGTFKNPSVYFLTVQLDLNLTLACAVPASKNSRSACAQPGPRIFCRFTHKRKSLVCYTRAHCTRRREPR